MKRISIALLGLGFAACNTATAEHTDRPAASAQATPQAAMHAPAAPGPAAAPSPAPAGALTRVTDASQVCMVNNQFMARPQIPVVVEGKTYYGCCEMCKGRLQNDAAARTAKDPVSGEAVDKSAAIIGKTPSGAVLYFASAENLQRYAAQR